MKHKIGTQLFFRPLGYMACTVVHVTDGGFWEGPAVENGEPIEHGYAETVSALQGQGVRVFAFSSDGLPSYAEGFSDPYMGMTAIPFATDGARFDVADILDGQVSLTDALNGIVLDKFCEPFPPIE